MAEHGHRPPPEPPKPAGTQCVGASGKEGLGLFAELSTEFTPADAAADGPGGTGSHTRGFLDPEDEAVRETRMKLGLAMRAPPEVFQNSGVAARGSGRRGNPPNKHG